MFRSAYEACWQYLPCLYVCCQKQPVHMQMGCTLIACGGLAGLSVSRLHDKYAGFKLHAGDDEQVRCGVEKSSLAHMYSLAIDDQ